MSATVAHEYSHLADYAQMGEAPIEAASRAHDAKEARKRAWPELLAGLGGSALFAANIQYLESTSTAAGASTVANVLTGLMAVACMGLAGIRYAERKRKIGNVFEVYRSRPEEVRAFNREDAYRESITADTLLVTALTPQEMSPELSQKLRQLSGPTIPASAVPAR